MIDASNLFFINAFIISWNDLTSMDQAYVANEFYTVWLNFNMELLANMAINQGPRNFKMKLCNSSSGWGGLEWASAVTPTSS